MERWESWSGETVWINQANFFRGGWWQTFFPPYLYHHLSQQLQNAQILVLSIQFINFLLIYSQHAYIESFSTQLVPSKAPHYLITLLRRAMALKAAFSAAWDFCWGDWNFCWEAVVLTPEAQFCLTGATLSPGFTFPSSYSSSSRSIYSSPSRWPAVRVRRSGDVESAVSLDRKSDLAHQRD